MCRVPIRRYSPAALAALPRDAGGEQVLIYPTQDPDDRKAILNEMAVESAYTPAVQAIVRFVLGMLVHRLGRAPTPEEVAQGLLDALYELVEYQGDPAGDLDYYQSSLITLRPVPGNPISPLTRRPKGSGDCEDTSVLFSALANAVPLVCGMPMHGAVQWLDQKDDPQNHVAAKVFAAGLPADGAWVETTLPSARIGEHPYEALRRLGNAHAARLTGVSGALRTPVAHNEAGPPLAIHNVARYSRIYLRPESSRGAYSVAVGWTGNGYLVRDVPPSFGREPFVVTVAAPDGTVREATYPFGTSSVDWRTMQPSTIPADGWYLHAAAPWPANVVAQPVNHSH